jgi:hypothetical protein
MSKLEYFFKSILYEGVYLIFGGVTNITPWSDFKNLAICTKSTSTLVKRGSTIENAQFFILLKGYIHLTLGSDF